MALHTWRFGFLCIDRAPVMTSLIALLVPFSIITLPLAVFAPREISHTFCGEDTYHICRIARLAIKINRARLLLDSRVFVSHGRLKRATHSRGT